MHTVEPAAALSVVMPVYNEARTIGAVIVEVTRALPGVRKQIIIVDDHSSDGTSAWLKRNLERAGGVWRGISLDGDGELRLSAAGLHNEADFSIDVLFHERNRGKGAAVRTGLAH